MRTVIDAAGRVVVVDRRIELEVPATPMRLGADENGPVAIAARTMPVLTAETVRETMERIRR